MTVGKFGCNLGPKGAANPAGALVNLRIVLLLFGFTIVTAFSNGFDLLFRLAYVMVGGTLLSFVWALGQLRGVKVRQERTLDRAQVGQTMEERLRIENESPLPKVGLEVEVQSDLPGHQNRSLIHLGSHKTRSWRYRVECRRRGRYTLGPVLFTGTDPFGLFRFQLRQGEAHTLLIYPATVELPEFPLSGPELPGSERLRQRTHYVTPNAATIRDYVFGDSYNRIHWPSTARTGRLMVKEFELDPGSHVWIVLDLYRSVQAGAGDESTEEYGVTIAASLAKKYLSASRSVGLIAYGQGREVVAAERGGSQLIKILEVLAMARAEGLDSLQQILFSEGRRFGRNPTLILITPSTEEPWLGALEHLRHPGTKPLVIFLEPASFGGRARPEPVLARLQSEGIPHAVVRQGEAIAEALALSPGNAARAAPQPYTPSRRSYGVSL